MARFNEILVGHFNRGLQKLTGIKGGPPVPALASEIIPVLPLPLGAEYRYLDSWQEFGATVSEGAGGAGNISILQLRNPAGSNVIAVVFKIDIIPNANQSNLSGPTPLSVDFGTVFSPQRFDARGQQNPTLIFTGKNNTATTFSGQTIAVVNSSVPNTVANVPIIQFDEQEIPILPGDGIQITAITANNAVAASVWWRERFLEESERF